MPGDTLSSQPAPQGAVIEFVGIPGSGKSYLAKYLSADPGFTTLRLVARTEGRAAAYLRYARLFAQASGDIVHTLIGSGVFSRSEPRKMRRWRLKLLLRCIVLANRIGCQVRPGSAQTLVLDQGLLQSLLSCRMAGLKMRPEMVDRLLAQGGTLPDTRLVVLHTATLEVAMSSVQTRTNNQLPALAMFEGLELQRLFARYQEAFAWITALLNERAYTTLHTNRGDPTDHSLARLRAAVQMNAT